MNKIFELHQKNENVLVATGGINSPWFWRNDELSYKQFTQLTTIEKENYVNFLLSIDKSELGTNDEYILRLFGPEEITKNKKFLSIDENIK